MISHPESLVVENLHVQLAGFFLDHVSFTVERGRITGFLGENGAGKSTTLRLLIGLMRKDGGNVRIGNLDHVADEKEFKRRIGFVPEESCFYDAMTVANFLAFASGFYRDWNPQTCEGLLRQFDLPGRKRLGQLSKGMRMKVSLVVALSHEPDVLLMDEPTSGLDPRSRIELLDLLRSVAHDGGRAILFSTHNLPEVERVGDRVVVIHNGRILAEESIEPLRCGPSWTLENYYLGLVT